MNKNDRWEQISRAKKILKLGETTTITQIKHAYRDLAKTHHPDTAELDVDRDTSEIQKLNEAYRVLLKYCENHPISLEKQEGQLDDEDWWMDRFGNDPLWGRGKKQG